MSKSPAKAARKTTASPLMVRLDAESKTLVAQAAGLRRISVSDYVRTVTVAQARREVESACDQTIPLEPEEQLVFGRRCRFRRRSRRPRSDSGH